MKLTDAAKHLDIEPAFLIKFLNERSRNTSEPSETANSCLIIEHDPILWSYKSSRKNESEHQKILNDILSWRRYNEPEGADNSGEHWSDDDEINRELLILLENRFFIDKDQFMGPESIHDAICFLRSVDDPDELAGVLLILSVLTANLNKIVYLELDPSIIEYRSYAFRFLQGKTFKANHDETVRKGILDNLDIINRYLKQCDYWRSDKPKTGPLYFKYQKIGLLLDEAYFGDLAIFLHDRESLYQNVIGNTDVPIPSLLAGATEEQKCVFWEKRDYFTRIINSFKSNPRLIHDNPKVFKNVCLSWVTVDAYQLFHSGIHDYKALIDDPLWLKMLNTLPLHPLREVIEENPIFCKYKEVFSFDFYVGVAVVLVHGIRRESRELDLENKNGSSSDNLLLLSPDKSSKCISYIIDKIGQDILRKYEWSRDQDFRIMGDQVIDLCLDIYHYFSLLYQRMMHRHIEDDVESSRTNLDYEDELWHKARCDYPSVKVLWDKCAGSDKQLEGSFDYLEYLVEVLRITNIHLTLKSNHIFAGWSKWMANPLIQIAINLSSAFPGYIFRDLLTAIERLGSKNRNSTDNILEKV